MGLKLGFRFASQCANRVGAKAKKKQKQQQHQQPQ